MLTSGKCLFTSQNSRNGTEKNTVRASGPFQPPEPQRLGLGRLQLLHTHTYHQQQQTPRRTPRAPKAPLLSWVHEEPVSNASDMLVFCPQALS